MEYIGNYADWIKPEWLDYMANNTGKIAPQLDKEAYSDTTHGCFTEYNHGLQREVWYETFEPANFPFDFECPFGDINKTDWWFVKMSPGGALPMHVDGSDTVKWGDQEPRRYWMPLNDYTDGHIYISEDVFYPHYRAGDVFEHTGKMHGGANVNANDIVRYTLNFWIYK